MGCDAYTRQFGGDSFTQVEVLDIRPNLPGVTIVDDLTLGTKLASESFDCVILTQTLQYIFELEKAICTLHRILKPGGVVLGTVPGIAQIAPEESKYCGDYWRFTTASAERLFKTHFQDGEVHVVSYGNVLASTAFLYGLAAEELRKEELDFSDPEYQFLIGVRAVKHRPA